MTGMIGKDAKELGKNAYTRGFSIDTNPFRDGTKEAKDFKVGWKFAHKQISAKARCEYSQAKKTLRNDFNS